MNWTSFWYGFAAFPVVSAAVAVLAALVARLCARNRGVGGCPVCDDGFTCEIGDYTNLGIWLRSRRHNWVIASSRWHRESWANCRWNPYRNPGVPDDDGTAAPRRAKPSIVRRAWWWLSE